MALDNGALTSALVDWINGMSNYSTAADSYKVLGKAYEAFCLGAEDVTGDPPAAVKTSDFISILTSKLPGGASVDAAAAAYAEACVKMWTGVTFQMSMFPPGAITEVSATVTTPPVQAAAKSLFMSLFNKKSANTAEVAKNWANTLHDITITTVVQCTGIGPPPASPPIIVSGPIQ